MSGIVEIAAPNLRLVDVYATEPGPKGVQTADVRVNYEIKEKGRWSVTTAGIGLRAELVIEFEALEADDMKSRRSIAVPLTISRKCQRRGWVNLSVDGGGGQRPDYKAYRLYVGGILTSPGQMRV